MQFILIFTPEAGIINDVEKKSDENRITGNQHCGNAEKKPGGLTENGGRESRDVIKKLVAWLGIIIISGTMLLMVKTTVTDYSVSSLLLGLIALAAVLAICYAIINCNYNESIMLAVILFIAFGLRLIFITLVKTVPETDFSRLLSAAKYILKKDYSQFQPESGYFWAYGYQIPFCFYEAGILKLFGTIDAIKIFNALFITGTCLLMYMIIKPMNSKVALAAAFLYAVYPESIMLSSVLTNQHVALFFMFLGIYFYLNSKCILSGISLILSNLMRQGAIIVLIAIVCHCLYLWIREKNARKMLPCIKIILSYFILKKIIAFAFVKSGIAPYGIDANVPQWKFAVGLDFSGYGGYLQAEEHEYILSPAYTSSERWAETWKIISSSYKSIGDSIKFFASKIVTMWCRTKGEGLALDGLNGNDTMISGLSYFRVTDILNIINLGVYFTIWGGALAGAIGFVQKKNGINDTSADDTPAFPALITFIGFFLIYLIIEVMERYRFEAIAVMLIITAAGLKKYKK